MKLQALSKTRSFSRFKAIDKVYETDIESSCGLLTPKISQKCEKKKQIKKKNQTAQKKSKKIFH